MHLSWSAEDEAFRKSLQAFLDEHIPDELREGNPLGRGPGELNPAWARRWQATLFDHGWMVPANPPHLGGRDATPTQSRIHLGELARRDVPRSAHMAGHGVVAPSLLEFGTPGQRALAPAAIRGDTVWCVGMSEPGAGSDLGALSTRATRDGDGFVVSGQKVWTSYAPIAQLCFCYVRTGPAEARHRGLTVLIIDMTAPGVQVRPLRDITGSAEFAEVFFTDVRVPAANVVGEVGGGWRVAMASLAHERAGLGPQAVARAARTLDDLVRLVRARDLHRDPVVRRRVAAAYAEVQSLRALSYQGGPGSEASYVKLAASELSRAIGELGTDLLGAHGAAVDEERDPVGARWVRSSLAGYADTIVGGTSEIQRNVIAERVLGLPRGH